MAAAVTLLVFCSLLFVAGAQQQSYFELPVAQRGGVELALTHIKQAVAAPFHYRFYQTAGLREFEMPRPEVKYVQQRLSLKPTTCAKGTTDPQQTCPFRNDRAMMDCGVCFKTVSDQIQSTPKPFVHCITRPRLTQEIQTLRRTRCDGMMEYIIGSFGIAGAIDPNDPFWN